METLFRLLPSPQSVAVRYSTTTILVLVGFALRYSVGEGTGRYGFIHFILPVLAAALLFDRTAGFFAIALSVGLIVCLLDWQAGASSHLVAIAIFCVVATCIVYVAEGLRTALTKAQAAQEASVLLLAEMSHRVKNKFSMISAIIGLQSRDASPEVVRALSDVAARVQVMATVHDYLQISRHDGLIDMSEYLPSLGHALRQALCGPRPISLKVHTAREELPADKALTVGLIVNELVTNAMKYAFEADRQGTVLVQLKRIDEELELSVSDDGRGYRGTEKTGLGTRLVTVLAAQIGGRADWKSDGSGGCTAAIKFPAV
jgi:two-component sensor histidine kinase